MREAGMKAKRGWRCASPWELLRGRKRAPSHQQWSVAKRTCISPGGYVAGGIDQPITVRMTAAHIYLLQETNKHTSSKHSDHDIPMLVMDSLADSTARNGPAKGRGKTLPPPGRHTTSIHRDHEAPPTSKVAAEKKNVTCLACPPRITTLWLEAPAPLSSRQKKEHSSLPRRSLF